MGAWHCLSHPQHPLLPPKPLGWWELFGSELWYLAVQGLLVGQLAFQLVIEVMDGGSFSLGCQVAFLQRGDPLLHVLFLSQGLGKRRGCHILICDHQFGNNWATQLLQARDNPRVQACDENPAPHRKEGQQSGR